MNFAGVDVDNPPPDLLYNLSNVGCSGQCDFDKAEFESLASAIERGTLKRNRRKMNVGIDGMALWCITA